MNLIHHSQVYHSIYIDHFNICCILANGLKSARNTGRAMINANLIADVCLSSTALRCIQTAERILTGRSEYQ